MGFPDDFVWGAATSAYQIEGASDADGKGPSIWDMMCRRAGAVWRGDKGDVACDHYHRYKEDVAIMKEIGLKAYRMSISWPRVLPEGVGPVNTPGLDFYDRLIDELLAAGVQPYVNLFHWDYPYELYCRGGWANRNSPDWFAEFAGVVVRKLSDRVTNWMTMNEPQCFIGLGHLQGIHAPGLKLNLAEVLRAGHNALLAHGKAVQVIRSRAQKKCTIGFAPVGILKIPAKLKRADSKGARIGTFSVEPKNCWNSVWWMDPVYLGRYPEEGLKAYGAAVPHPNDGDMETISQPLDYFGVNIYFALPVRMGKNGEPEDPPPPPGYNITTMEWPVTPTALYWGPKFFYERYKKPIIITENGMSNIDWLCRDGRVHDPQRIDFLHNHLLALRKACDDGIQVKGYFVWSLMDNFEWALGYSKRFGIVYVDYKTQKRIMKDSAYWYKEVIASNGKSLDSNLDY